MKITVSSPIIETPRVLQVRGMFDLAQAKTSSVQWNVDLPLDEKPWHIGLIVGPSGCGKSTLANRLWPENSLMSWRVDRSILDSFPEALSVKDVTEILSSVGFASPPAWLRPFHVLSTGQQFRVQLARLIAESLATEAPQGPIVVDEFTSVVDRTVARIGSAAVARTIRKKKLQFVAVSCHEDVEEWLQADWVYRPRGAALHLEVSSATPQHPSRNRSLPGIGVALIRTASLSERRLGTLGDVFLGALAKRGEALQPVAFSAWLPFFGAGPPARREHRTVTLPDYQGVGIGNALSALIASMWKALGYRALSTTTHPAMMQARCASPLWRMHRAPALAGRGDKIKHASTRMTAGFSYIGPALGRLEAKALLG